MFKFLLIPKQKHFQNPMWKCMPMSLSQCHSDFYSVCSMKLLKDSSLASILLYLLSFGAQSCLQISKCLSNTTCCVSTKVVSFFLELLPWRSWLISSPVPVVLQPHKAAESLSHTLILLVNAFWSFLSLSVICGLGTGPSLPEKV